MEEGQKRPRRTALINPKLEEQLKNAELKDLVLSNLEYLEPENARELARLLLWSDSAFSFGLIGQLPRSLNFVIAFFDEMGKQLQNVPPELLRQFASEMARKVDMKSVAALPAAYTPLLAAFNRTSADSPGYNQLQQEIKIKVIRETIESTDFGKVRVSFKKHLEGSYPLLESAAAGIISDPVAFANLVNIIPPLLNHTLKLTASSLEQLNYPSEILASAVFNLASDIETGEIASIINNINRLIRSTHEGSAVLGGSEPRFRQVAGKIMEETLQDLDHEAAAGALLALGEDLETILYAAVDTAAKKPELTAALLTAMVQGTSASMRGVCYMLDHLNDLSPGSLAQFTNPFLNSETPGSAELVNGLLTLCNRIFAENPELCEKAAVSFLQAVDKDQLHQLQYNILSIFLNRLDQDQVSAFLINTSGQLSASLAENPRLSRSVVKSFVNIFWGALKGSFKKVGKREGSTG